MWRVLMVLCVWAMPAGAQPTMQVLADGGGYYTQLFDVTPGVPFDVVVTVRSEGLDLSGVDFSYSGIQPTYPGVFLLSRTYPGPATLDFGDPESGIHRIRFDGCAPACEMREVMRIRYGDFGGHIGADFIITIGPASASVETSELQDCGGGTHSAPMGWSDRPCSGAGVYGPRGSLMLNPTPLCFEPGRPESGNIRSDYYNCDAVVSIQAPTWSTFKARFVD